MTKDKQASTTAEGILDKYLNNFNWPHWSKENALKAMQEYASQFQSTDSALKELPGEIEAGQEAKKYGDEMNKDSQSPSGFHELDFYNGTIYFRDKAASILAYKDKLLKEAKEEIEKLKKQIKNELRTD